MADILSQDQIDKLLSTDYTIDELPLYMYVVGQEIITIDLAYIEDTLKIQVVDIVTDYEIEQEFKKKGIGHFILYVSKRDIGINFKARLDAHNDDYDLSEKENEFVIKWLENNPEYVI